MRSRCGLAGALIAALFAIVCGTANALAQSFPDPSDEESLYRLAKQEGKLVWYIGGPLDAMSLVAAEFEKKYPGIKVEVQRFPGVALYQRFMRETEAGQYLADAMQLTDEPAMKDLIDNGHIAAWRVPTHDRFGDKFHIGTFAYAPLIIANVIAYNRNKVTPEEARLLASSWQAVFDPRFKGRYAILIQNCGSCYGPIHMFLDPKLINEYGPAFMRRLVVGRPPAYLDTTMAVDRVVAGDQDFVDWVSDTSPYAPWLAHAPIAWVFPRPTPMWPVHWMAISKYAQHPNAARLFQNWQMSEDGARAYQLKAGLMTSMSGVPDMRPVTKESWYHAPKEKYDIDYDRWGRNFDKDMALWQKIVAEAK